MPCFSVHAIDGPPSDQHVQITAFRSDLEVFTVNNSFFQEGFYLFAACCGLGMLISTMIDNRPTNQQWALTLRSPDT